jgi:rhodanese-related sulfurtransferase
MKCTKECAKLCYASRLIQKGAIILDTRTKEEFCSGHLCGAILVETPLPPLNRQQKYTLKEKLMNILEDVDIEDDFPIIIYCKKGIRATIAEDILSLSGFENVLMLGGVEVEPLKRVFSNRLSIDRLKVCRCQI